MKNSKTSHTFYNALHVSTISSIGTGELQWYEKEQTDKERERERVCLSFIRLKCSQNHLNFLAHSWHMVHFIWCVYFVVFMIVWNNTRAGHLGLNVCVRVWVNVICCELITILGYMYQPTWMLFFHNVDFQINGYMAIFKNFKRFRSVVFNFFMISIFCCLDDSNINICVVKY